MDLLIKEMNLKRLGFHLQKKKDKEKYQHSPFNGIKTRDTTSVMTYDLEEGTLKTVSLRAWEILNFITITEENVLVLDQLVRDCLKR